MQCQPGLKFAKFKKILLKSKNPPPLPYWQTNGHRRARRWVILYRTSTAASSVNGVCAETFHHPRKRINSEERCQPNCGQNIPKTFTLKVNLYFDLAMKLGKLKRPQPHAGTMSGIIYTCCPVNACTPMLFKIVSLQLLKRDVPVVFQMWCEQWRL